MNTGILATKLKNGRFWTGLISVVFVLSAFVIFVIDQIKDGVSFYYIIAAMLCIYVAAISIFIDIFSLRIKSNRKNLPVCITFLAVEIAVAVFTVLVIRRFAVLQNELNLLYSELSALQGSETANEIYENYMSLSRGMSKFYWQMGILFMMWWVPPFIVYFVKAQHVEKEEEEPECKQKGAQT